MQKHIANLIIVLLVAVCACQLGGVLQVPAFTSWACFASITLIVMWNYHKNPQLKSAGSGESEPTV
jgi:hypothetical protein